VQTITCLKQDIKSKIQKKAKVRTLVEINKPLNSKQQVLRKRSK